MKIVIFMFSCQNLFVVGFMHFSKVLIEVEWCEMMVFFLFVFFSGWRTIYSLQMIWVPVQLRDEQFFCRLFPEDVCASGQSSATSFS